MREARARLLIEEWLPAAVIGLECIRERSTGQQPSGKRLHVWWVRRPLVVSRVARGHTPSFARPMTSPMAPPISAPRKRSRRSRPGAAANRNGRQRGSAGASIGASGRPVRRVCSRPLAAAESSPSPRRSVTTAKLGSGIQGMRQKAAGAAPAPLPGSV